MLTFTDRAADALVLFHKAAARWDPNAKLRLEPSGSELTPQLAEGPADGDVGVQVRDITVYVPATIEGTVDAGDHNVLSVVAS